MHSCVTAPVFSSGWAEMFVEGSMKPELDSLRTSFTARKRLV